MEKFVKIKRPYKVADARIKIYKGVSYAECLVTNEVGEMLAVATKSATQQLLEILDDVNLSSKFVETEKTGKAVALLDIGLVAWLTVNQYGHSITFIRKEK